MSMTDADAVLAQIADLDRSYEQNGHGPDSDAREILAESAETIRALQVEIARLQGQNELLCEINAALRIVPSEPETPSDRVVRWLRARFAERPEWLPSEMLHVARNDGIDLGFWSQHPDVKAAVEWRQTAELWPGWIEPVWRLKASEAEGSVAK